MNQEIQASLEGNSSLKLNKQAYITSLTSEQDKPPEQKSQLQTQEQRIQFLEEATIDPAPTAEQIYKQHRQFLENYKRQRQREREAQTSQHHNPPQDYRKEHRRSVSTAQYGAPSKQSQALVMQRLQGIQEKLAQQITSQRFQNERPAFKLFAEVVENKNDIQRVSKERRFLRSQQSRHYEYHQPAMPARSKLPAGLRVRTEGIVDEVELGRNAREFIERVQKQQERLLGKHLLRRKVEESRRAAEEGLQGRRAVEETDLKREERRLKAETNLILMKEKIKLAKIIQRQPSDIEGKVKLKNFRYSLRGGKTGETQIRQRPEEENTQGTKVASDRLAGLKEPEYNIKDRIAIRKHKNLRPTEYREPPEESLRQKGVNTEHNFAEREGVQSDGLANREGSNSQEEGSLPCNHLQNEFITFTQYQEAEQRGSRLKKERHDPQSSLQ